MQQLEAQVKINWPSVANGLKYHLITEAVRVIDTKCYRFVLIPKHCYCLLTNIGK